jgi:hypothetical protein
MTIKAIATTIPLVAIKAPNIIVFAQNPCLAVGDQVQLTNLKTINCFRGLDECLTVTVAPTLVAGRWEVATNGSWSSLTGQTTLELTASSTGSAMFCGANASAATPPVEAKVCSGLPNPANFTGYVYTRPPNTPASIGAVTLANGSNVISTKGASSFNAKPGDLVTIDSTSPAFSATVLSSATGRNSDGERVSTYTLSSPVSGLTATGVNGALPCVSATAKPQPIAPLFFSLECGCTIRATLDKSFTSNPNFPQGTLVDGHGCTRQQYCFVINGNIPGADVQNYSGTITL